MGVSQKTESKESQDLRVQPDQKLANAFYKGPESNYFSLASYTISAATPLILEHKGSHDKM